MAENSPFQFSTSAMDVERAVAELRFGRPVILKDGKSKLAALALDSVAPDIYDQFAIAVGRTHNLYLTTQRAAKLGVPAEDGIAVPLKDVSFAEASRLAYALDAKRPLFHEAGNAAMEAAAELARTALLLPAVICADVTGIEDRFAACCSLDHKALAGSGTARQNFEIVVRTPVPLKDLGRADFVVFRGGLAQKDQVAIVVGKPDTSRPVPVRIHSSCLTGDLCGSLKCDCGDQLRNGLHQLKEAGGGVLLYLDQEGRGTGIGAKMRAYGYQHLGLDTIDADAMLGFGEDHRRYEAAIAMLRLLGIAKVVLHTNNPSKIAALKAGGITVKARVAVTGTVNDENVRYLETKRLRAGHMIDLRAMIAAE
ncbi:GTP cyclohydrolase II RibA [Rhizobium sp. PAMB 3182]